MDEEICPRKKLRIESLSPEASETDDNLSNHDEINDKKCANTEIIYDPSSFIRCHGSARSNKSPSETKVQVWDIAFEPDKTDPQKTTNIIATCGGNSICLIDVLSGEVLMKYSHKEKGENFYTIAWTLLPHVKGGKKSMLVSGSKKGEISMFYPDEKDCFYVWPFCRDIGEEEKYQTW